MDSHTIPSYHTIPYHSAKWTECPLTATSWSLPVLDPQISWAMLVGDKIWSVFCIHQRVYSQHLLAQKRRKISQIDPLFMCNRFEPTFLRSLGRNLYVTQIGPGKNIKNKKKPGPFSEVYVVVVTRTINYPNCPPININNIKDNAWCLDRLFNLFFGCSSSSFVGLQVANSQLFTSPSQTVILCTRLLRSAQILCAKHEKIYLKEACFRF